MPDGFDPYYKWLGIPPEEQPPNHYRLLGLQEFESDADVIANAADRQMSHLRDLAGGKHLDLAQQILNELAKARLCLLAAKTKAAYDAELGRELARRLSSIRKVEAVRRHLGEDDAVLEAPHPSAPSSTQAADSHQSAAPQQSPAAIFQSVVKFPQPSPAVSPTNNNNKPKSTALAETAPLELELGELGFGEEAATQRSLLSTPVSAPASPSAKSRPKSAPIDRKVDIGLAGDEGAREKSGAPAPRARFADPPRRSGNATAPTPLASLGPSPLDVPDLDGQKPGGPKLASPLSPLSPLEGVPTPLPITALSIPGLGSLSPGYRSAALIGVWTLAMVILSVTTSQPVLATAVIALSGAGLMAAYASPQLLPRRSPVGRAVETYGEFAFQILVVAVIVLPILYRLLESFKLLPESWPAAGVPEFVTRLTLVLVVPLLLLLIAKGLNETVCHIGFLSGATLWFVPLTLVVALGSSSVVPGLRSAHALLRNNISTAGTSPEEATVPQPSPANPPPPAPPPKQVPVTTQVDPAASTPHTPAATQVPTPGDPFDPWAQPGTKSFKELFGDRPVLSAESPPERIGRAVRYDQVQYLVGPLEAFKGRLGFLPGPRRSAFGVRWAFGVSLLDFRKTDDPRQVTHADAGLGSVGARLVKLLKEDVEADRFGSPSPSGAHRALSVVDLGVGAPQELESRAWRAGADALLHFELTARHTDRSWVNTMLVVRLIDGASDFRPASQPLAHTAARSAEKCQAIFDDVKGAIRSGYSWQLLQEQHHEPALSRWKALSGIREPQVLPVLVELRGYLAKGWIDEKEFATAADTLLGGTGGQTLLSGTGEEKHALLKPYLEPATTP